MMDRTATDTIKGYFYQFDFAILKLLESGKDTDTVTVEGVEDVDIQTAGEDTAIQCKYYAKTEYNHSVIARPIRLMLGHYNEVKKGSKKKLNYFLYGHFQSGQHKLATPIGVDFLKDNFLTYTEKKIVRKHHSELSLTDADLLKFLGLLTIDINALEYYAQLDKISKLLMKTYQCKQFEAEAFFYNNAIKFIKDVSVNGNISKRVIKKGDFIKQINSKQILFNEWFIHFKGRKQFLSELRGHFFTSLNLSSYERFFLIELATDCPRADAKDLILTVARKWSKLSKREVRPFCPYIYLHNISSAELIALKQELHSEGHLTVDGFNFSGAAFDAQSIARPATYGNQIKVKLVNDLAYLPLIIDQLSKTKEIYQFYLSIPFFTRHYSNIKQVNIQIEQLQDIKQII